MKMLFTAVALMTVFPALAQTAPAGGPAGPAAHAAPGEEAKAAQTGHGGHSATQDPHAGHRAPAASGASPSCTPEHAAMGHCQLPKSAPVGKSDADAGSKRPQK
jgi:copper resistance protein B